MCPYFTDYMDYNATIRRVHLEPPEGTSVNKLERAQITGTHDGVKSGGRVGA